MAATYLDSSAHSPGPPAAEAGDYSLWVGSGSLVHPVRGAIGPRSVLIVILIRFVDDPVPTVGCDCSWRRFVGRLLGYRRLQ